MRYEIQNIVEKEKNLSHLLVYLVTGLFCTAAIVGNARGEVKEWTVGEGGLSWKSQEKNSSAIDFDVPQAIQLVAFEDENIVAQLDWEPGIPAEYISEQAKGRTWDNVPFTQIDATLAITDGDPSTSTEDRFKQFGVLQAGRSFYFDLGTRFPANRIAFFPRQEGVDSEGRPFAEDFIRSYELLISNGLRFAEDGRPIYNLPPLKTVPFTRESIAEILSPLQFIRYIRLNVLSTNPFEIAEFQVFGRGFPPQGKYLSKIVDLGERANFSQLEWTVEKLRLEDDGVAVRPDAEARISVQMRTGTDDTPLKYYEIVNVYTGEQQEVTEAQYNGLSADIRGRVKDDQDNWSRWSAPFTASGETIDLPSPRRYFQFEASLESQAFLDGMRLKSLSVEHAVPPLAGQLLGEISLLDVPQPSGNKPTAPAGEFSTFAYDIIADVGADEVGFDGIEISTPAKPKFRELLIDGSPVSVAPNSLVESPGRLSLAFPAHRVTSRTFLRIIFDAQVFKQATVFNARAFDSQSNEAPQKVLPGDANPEVVTIPSHALRVLTSSASARNLLPFFQIAPRVFSPNGDGLNDSAEISYTLVQLTRPIAVEVAVFDLSGRRVRILFADEEDSGAYTRTWDGRDDSGALLPVGIYLVRVAVKAEREEFVRTRTAGLVY